MYREGEGYKYAERLKTAQSSMFQCLYTPTFPHFPLYPLIPQLFLITTLYFNRPIERRPIYPKKKNLLIAQHFSSL